ncbi:MAG: hypothetical protein ACTSRS_07570 [Candidatus Helarchaeota archaeon]
MAGRRFFTRQFETIIILLLFLTVLAIVLIPINDEIFPANGGFTRNVFFIQSKSNQIPSYFILVDEVKLTHESAPIDWVLHGRGDLRIFNQNQSAVWTVPSYNNASRHVRFYVIFIKPNVIITQFQGPFYPRQNYASNRCSKARQTWTSQVSTLREREHGDSPRSL